MMETKSNISQAEARKLLWRKGNLRWKLDSTQKGLYDLFYNSKHKILTWLLSRRQGKTYTLCILALEQCLKKPNSIVKFVSPTKTQVNNNVRPIFRQLLQDCPEDLKPDFKQKDYIFYFPNGSEIQLAGSDSGHAEKLRGGDSDLFFVDEAGSCDDLENVVKSILLPTTLITKGRGVLASTPPKDPEHDFIRYIEEAEMRGSLVIKTIDDNPRITEEDKQTLIAELGGENTEEAQRELYCRLIKDSTKCVIPEFDDVLEKKIVKEWERPPFFDSYVSMDTGGVDLTVILYGYYDFRADKIIIEDETVIDFQNKDESIDALVKNINTKERDLWTDPLTHEYRAPFLRVSDVDYIFTQLLCSYSKKTLPIEQVINFTVARKDDNASAINNLRTLIANGKIIINPKCKTLIRHLRNAKWDKNKIKFTRSTDNGHYDAVDTLKYLVRHIAFHKNPYPSNYGMNMKDLFVRDPKQFSSNPSNQVETYKKLFNVKPVRRKY